MYKVKRFCLLLAVAIVVIIALAYPQNPTPHNETLVELAPEIEAVEVPEPEEIPEPVVEAEETPETTPEVETVVEAEETDTHLKLENVRLSHYCICEKCCGKLPDHPAYGLTASGRVAEPYVSVAVDPSVIPLGSTVYIEYDNGTTLICRADDTGGAINGERIDLCVNSHQEALELGIETVTVYWE